MPSHDAASGSCANCGSAKPYGICSNPMCQNHNGPIRSAAWPRRLRYRIGVWLLKPHWLPLLEHYNRMQLPKHNPHGRVEQERCTYITIGIKYALGKTGGWWPK